MTQREIRLERRALLVDWKGGKCEKCDYSKYIGALHFHHKDPSEKLFKLTADNMSRSMSKLMAEVNKCSLLCGNCHAEVHAGVS